VPTFITSVDAALVPKSKYTIRSPVMLAVVMLAWAIDVAEHLIICTLVLPFPATGVVVTTSTPDRPYVSDCAAVAVRSVPSVG